MLSSQVLFIMLPDTGPFPVRSQLQKLAVKRSNGLSDSPPCHSRWIVERCLVQGFKTASEKTELKINLKVGRQEGGSVKLDLAPF